MPRELDKILGELEEADRAVDRTKAAYDEATTRRLTLAVEAADAGGSLSVIAGRLGGKSVTRVRQLLARGRGGG